MANKLSRVQQRALDRLREEFNSERIGCAKWFSAYDLGESLATLNALFRAKLVERRTELGSMAFARSCIFYRYKA